MEAIKRILNSVLQRFGCDHDLAMIHLVASSFQVAWGNMCFARCGGGGSVAPLPSYHTFDAEGNLDFYEWQCRRCGKRFPATKTDVENNEVVEAFMLPSRFWSAGRDY
jgi:hypothetical protein